MNSNLVVVAGLLLAFVSTASAGTITVNSVSRTTTATQDAAMVARKEAHNAELCTSKQLARTCSQAAYAAADGEGTIYAATAAGTANYVQDRIAEMVAAVERQVNEIERTDVNTAWRAASAAQRGAACTALGKTTACQ